MLFSAASLLALAVAQPSAPKALELKDGDRVVWIGNTFVEREQRYGYWETALLLANRNKKIAFRNLGWSGDTVHGDARAAFDNAAKGFERLVSLTLELKPTLILVSYGANEAFEGKEGLPKFEKGLEELLDAIKPANARIVLLSPVPFQPHEQVRNPKSKNEVLAVYRDVIKTVADKRGLGFADLFNLCQDLRAEDTVNGMHLSEHGYRVTAESVFLASLGQETRTIDWSQAEALRQAVVEKNQLFFYRWRPQNETYLFGFRKHEQGKNAKEVAEFDPLVAKAEDKIEELRKSLEK